MRQKGCYWAEVCNRILSTRLNQFDKVPTWVAEHDPARALAGFYAPGQLDPVSAQAGDGGVQVVHADGDLGKALLGLGRLALEDHQVSAAQVEVWTLAVVGDQRQADHITVEVGYGGDVLGVQADDVQAGIHISFKRL